MKINYGLWWYEQEGKKTVRKNRNFSIEHAMNWDDNLSHQAFRALILAKHPGTRIIGYAPENEGMTERYPALPGMICDSCNGVATYYEKPIPHKPEFYYSACDPCWERHDEYNKHVKDDINEHQ